MPITSVFVPCVYSALNAIPSSFPEANSSVAMVNPIIDGGISLLKYMSVWSGKGAIITSASFVLLVPLFQKHNSVIIKLN